MSDSVQPHRWQPTRLPRLWDSLGKNTGVGCHFLLQCMKVKSESEVTQSCPTLCDPMDCSLPGSSIHGIFQARVLEWGAIAFSAEGSLNPIIIFLRETKTQIQKREVDSGVMKPHGKEPNQKEAGRSQKDSSLGHQAESGPPNTLISDSAGKYVFVVLL